MFRTHKGWKWKERCFSAEFIAYTEQEERTPTNSGSWFIFTITATLAEILYSSGTQGNIGSTWKWRKGNRMVVYRGFSFSLVCSMTFFVAKHMHNAVNPLYCDIDFQRPIFFSFGLSYSKIVNLFAFPWNAIFRTMLLKSHEEYLIYWTWIIDDQTWFVHQDWKLYSFCLKAVHKTKAVVKV